MHVLKLQWMCVAECVAECAGAVMVGDACVMWLEGGAE